jgi:hypothetical protein
LPKTLRGKLENDSRKPRYLVKNMHCDNLKKGQLTLSESKIKKGDDIVDDDDDDDAVKISLSQDQVRATLELFLRTQYL